MVVRQMLVAKDRHTPTALAKDIDDLLEEFVARVQNLSEVVDRIIAMLTDQQHTVDIKAAVATQSFGHGPRQFDVVALRDLPAEIVLWILVVVHPRELKRR